MVIYFHKRGRHGRYHMVVRLQLLMQSSPITTYILTLNIAHGEVYPIQHYMIKLVNDLWFSLGILVSSTNKTDHLNIAEILL
jgi:hypothetical protein